MRCSPAEKGKMMIAKIREAFYEWLEWQDAKEWVKEFHPGWVQIAKKAKRKSTRLLYREKILKAYRGEDNGR